VGAMIAIAVLSCALAAVMFALYLMWVENGHLWDALSAKAKTEVLKKDTGAKEGLTESKQREEDRVKPRTSAQARLLAESMNREYFSAERRVPNSERMNRNG